jgi:hypothetical protein
VSVTHHIIPSRVAIRYGVMVLQGFLDKRQPHRHY